MKAVRELLKAGKALDRALVGFARDLARERAVSYLGALRLMLDYPAPAARSIGCGEDFVRAWAKGGLEP